MKNIDIYLKESIEDESYILDDNIEYVVVDAAIIDGNKYIFFANIDDEKDICFKKLISENGEDYFTGLDDENELNKVILYFTKQNIK